MDTSPLHGNKVVAPKGDIPREELYEIEAGSNKVRDYIDAAPIRVWVNSAITLGDRKVSRNPEDKPTIGAHKLGMKFLQPAPKAPEL